VAEIVLDHITKRFPDGSLAVNDFNLDIADGEFVILVGPSGCGKSTTLNMIAGLEDITEGELRIGGQVVNNKTPKDRDIAMVFQSYALYPHMTVRENMGFALKLAKTPQATINQKVEEAARILDLTQHLDRRPANLSGGQRQRVAMGRAIVREPDAFLMDEPLSNLDAKLRVETRATIIKLHQRLRTTTVYVTHDQTEAMTMSDRVEVFSNGRIRTTSLTACPPSSCPWRRSSSPRGVFRLSSVTACMKRVCGWPIPGCDFELSLWPLPANPLTSLTTLSAPLHSAWRGRPCPATHDSRIAP